MFQSRILLYVCLLLFAVGLTLMMAFYPRMPATVAAHFTASGQADQWTSKQAYFRALAGIHIGLAGVLVATAWAMRYIPMRFINLPNKDYWAAPEREDETRERVCVYMFELACATVALFDAVIYRTFQANLRPDRSVGYWPWVVLGAYLAWMIAWAVRLIGRFHRVPKEEANEI